MEFDEILNMGLGAILPIYEDGNVTKVITRDGCRLIDKRTLKTVLKNIAMYYGVDLVATRRQYGKLINKRHSIPIPFAAKLILIPFKVREKPLGKNDGTLGYVNFFEIAHVEDEVGSGACVVLKCGYSVTTLLGYATVLEYVKNARLVEKLYLSRHFETLGNDVIRELDSKKESYGMDIRGVIKTCPMDGSYEYDEAFLRKYLAELLIEVLRKQKNQAIK